MFLQHLIKKAKTIVDTTEEIDNHFFSEVMEELEKGYKDKGINGKSIAMSGGDEAKAKSLYIELRARDLQEKYVRKLQEEEKQELRKKRENELRVNMKQEPESGFFSSTEIITVLLALAALVSMFLIDYIKKML